MPEGGLWLVEVAVTCWLLFCRTLLGEILVTWSSLVGPGLLTFVPIFQHLPKKSNAYTEKSCRLLRMFSGVAEQRAFYLHRHTGRIFLSISLFGYVFKFYFHVKNIDKILESSLCNIRISTVFENHTKSLIQHCERSELRLHFEWTLIGQKNDGKCQN